MNPFLAASTESEECPIFGRALPEGLPKVLPSRRKVAKKTPGGHIGRGPCMPEDDPEAFKAWQDSKKRADYMPVTLRWLRSLGYQATRVDHFNAFGGNHVDFLGIFDVLALADGRPPLGVQLTSRGQVSTRVKKMEASEWLPRWLGAGCAAICVGWEPSQKSPGRTVTLCLSGGLIKTKDGFSCPES